MLWRPPLSPELHVTGLSGSSPLCDSGRALFVLAGGGTNGGQRRHRGADMTGPLLGARGGDRCALAVISLALDEVDAMRVLRRRGASGASLAAVRCSVAVASGGVSAETSPPRRRSSAACPSSADPGDHLVAEAGAGVVAQIAGCRAPATGARSHPVHMQPRSSASARREQCRATLLVRRSAPRVRSWSRRRTIARSRCSNDETGGARTVARHLIDGCVFV
jgi:hypothetical protein